MEGKIFYGVDIICQCTFTTVVVRFHAEVIVESKINIKCFTKSASHRDCWKDRKDDVIDLSPPTPVSHTHLQFLLIISTNCPGI